MRYWKRVDTQGNTTTVESYSHDLDIDGAIEITKKEFNDYITSLPVPIPQPVRDLAKEIDELIAKVTELEKKVK